MNNLKQEIIKKELEESEKQFTLFYDNIPLAYQSLDHNGNILDVNKTWLEYLGYTKEEVIGKWFGDFVDRDYLEVLLTNFPKFKEKGEIRNVEFKMKKKDGSYSIVKYNGKIAYDENMNFKQTHCIFQEISKQKRIEKELTEISNLKSDLIRRTSHELKTPLISILGFTNLLLDVHKDKYDSDTISILKDIKEGCDRLEVIINNLLKTSSLQSKHMEFKKSNEDLSFLIKYCVNELQGLAKVRNQSLTVEIYDKMMVDINKEEIHDVITHLIINAIKYTPPNGDIKVYSENESNVYIITVEDNGIGITIEESTQLFRKFGKIERYGHGWDVGIDGFGLGLYNSKKIVEMHGGIMWAESRGRNKGSKFSFKLPALIK